MSPSISPSISPSVSPSVSPSIAPSPYHVQTTGNTTSTEVDTIDVTFDSDTTTGNFILVGVSARDNEDAITAFNITDNKGNNYVEVHTHYGDVPYASLTMYYCENANGGSNHTITVNPNVNCLVTVSISEWTNIVTSNSIDSSRIDEDIPWTGSNPRHSSGNLTTTNTNDVLFSVYTHDAYAQDNAITPSTGWQSLYQVTNSVNYQVLSFDTREVSSHGNYHIRYSTEQPNSGTGQIILAAFKIEAGSPSISPSISPSMVASISESVSPSASPSIISSVSPSPSPTPVVVYPVSASPSISPSFSLSVSPSASPSISSEEPIFYRNPAFIFRNIANRETYLSSHQNIIPSWNALGRPKKQRPGTLGFNIQTNNLEIWNGKYWFKLSMKKV